MYRRQFSNCRKMWSLRITLLNHGSLNCLAIPLVAHGFSWSWRMILLVPQSSEPVLLNIFLIVPLFWSCTFSCGPLLLIGSLVLCHGPSFMWFSLVLPLEYTSDPHCSWLRNAALSKQCKSAFGNMLTSVQVLRTLGMFFTVYKKTNMHLCASQENITVHLLWMQCQKQN